MGININAPFERRSTDRWRFTERVIAVSLCVLHERMVVISVSANRRSECDQTKTGLSVEWEFHVATYNVLAMRTTLYDAYCYRRTGGNDGGDITGLTHDKLLQSGWCCEGRNIDYSPMIFFENDDEPFGFCAADDALDYSNGVYSLQPYCDNDDVHHAIVEKLKVEAVRKATKSESERS